MTRTSKWVALVGVLVALAGCPGKGAADARLPIGAEPAPRAYPSGTPIPGYETVKPDEVYVYDLPFRSSRTDTIKSKTADELVVERAVTLGAIPQPPRTVREPLVSSGHPFIPGGVELGSAFHKVAEDRIVISGRIFECDVFEASAGGQTVRYWIAPRYPFLVRSIANETTTVALKEILDHPVAAIEAPPLELHETPTPKK